MNGAALLPLAQGGFGRSGKHRLELMLRKGHDSNELTASCYSWALSMVCNCSPSQFGAMIALLSRR